MVFAFSLLMPVYSQTPVNTTSAPAVSVTPKPSTEMVIELEHKVKKGETLYAIGKHYHCSVAELQALNPGIGMLKPGMKVRVKQRTKVPMKSEPATVPQLNPVVNRPKEVAIASLPEVPANVVDHIVVKGQSLYSISKIYGVTVADIKKINKLTSDQLSINQKLWIPSKVEVASVSVNANPNQNALVKSPETAPSNNPENDAPLENSSNNQGANTEPQNSIDASKTPLKPETTGVSIKDSMSNEGGMPEQVATKIKTSNLKEYEKKVTVQIGYEGMKADRSWVMINKHKKGEVIAVINPENKKMVYCTVIGELPEKGSKHIAISQSVADRLGITEANATLRVRYVAQ